MALSKPKRLVVVGENDEMKMGWDRDSVVRYPVEFQGKETLLQCPCCYSIPRYPVVFQTNPPGRCAHTMCVYCHNRLVASTPTIYPDCPQCRVLLVTTLHFTEWHPHQSIMWESIRVPCCWDGCGQVLSPAEMRKHEYACERRRVHCPSEGCQETFVFEDMKVHMDKCKWVSEVCSDCGIVRRPKLDTEQHSCIKELQKIVKKLTDSYRRKGLRLPMDLPQIILARESPNNTFDLDETAFPLSSTQRAAPQRQNATMHEFDDEHIMAEENVWLSRDSPPSSGHDNSPDPEYRAPFI